ncbi:MAG: YqiA/YcfP family alpha/beta fold hydrolase [Bryobacter sp.]|nr:YqiA/YcfP family alpha/beta fold hydrolase [Bryobacter sp.]
MKFIYLHGFASSPASRKAQFFARKFAEAGVHLEVPSLETEGFENLTITAQLHVVEILAKGESVRLIGSSLGGYLAALYASLHPEVDRLLLLAPAFGFAERWELRLGSDVFAAWKHSGFLEVPHYATGTTQRVGFGLIEDGLRYPAEPAFPQPAIVFHGLADDVVPINFSRRFVAAHPHVELREKASGHELTDVMEEIWEESRTFLLA